MKNIMIVIRNQCFFSRFSKHFIHFYYNTAMTRMVIIKKKILIVLSKTKEIVNSINAIKEYIS